MINNASEIKFENNWYALYHYIITAIPLSSYHCNDFVVIIKRF